MPIARLARLTLVVRRDRFMQEQVFLHIWPDSCWMCGLAELCNIRLFAVRLDILFILMDLTCVRYRCPCEPRIGRYRPGPGCSYTFVRV